MWMNLFSLAVAPALLAVQAPQPRASIQCSHCCNGVATVVFEPTLTNVLTVDPAGRGETLEAKGITLRVQLRFPEVCGGSPVVGEPAASIVLWSPNLAYCIPLMASQPTDANGWTEFHGTFQAGGCAERLELYADGVYLATIPLRLNSPDTGTASPGHVDASDLGLFATYLGHPERYSICFDFNEDDRVDASDLCYFATALGSGCP